MKKKVLFVATVDSHIELFHLPYLKMFKEHGYEVHVATNSNKKIKYTNKKIELPIKRNPFSLANLKAVFRLKKILDKENYEIIHCHTPVGGVVARLAAKKARKNGTRVIYTAHGFHFYEGASTLNWLLYYPVEKYLAKYTDTLITINDEDFELAKSKFKKRCQDIQYVPGVGVDEAKFEKRLDEKQKIALRKSLKIKGGDKVIMCIGRLDRNKNQGFLIKMMPELIEKDKRYHLVLVGPDELRGRYQKLAENLGIIKNVHFLGVRNDISNLLQIADVAVSASKREGLPVNLIEAAMLGVPIVATDCRGNRDVCEAVGGKLAGQGDPLDFLKYIERLVEVSKKRDFSGYALSRVSENMKEIYSLNQDHKLSIVIPVYNCEKYISDCVSSIIKQNFNRKTEVIIIDDGSTDNSGRICDNLAKRYTNIKVFHYVNHGVSQARNFGLKKSTGDYVYFVDADDILLPGCLKTIYKAFAYNPDIVSVGRKRGNCNHSFMKKDNMNGDVSPIMLNINRAALVHRCQLSYNVVKKEILEKNNLRLNKKLQYTEDMDLALEILLAAKKIAFVKKILYEYRKNYSSATTYINRKRITDLIYFHDKWMTKLDFMKADAFGKSLEDFLAYQLLILMGMVDVWGDNDSTISDYIAKNTNILRANRTLKVRFGYLFYRIFGLKKTISVMGKYLSSKGVVKEVENV